MLDRAEALEAMIVAHSDEPADEGRDSADFFFSRLSGRIRAFLWIKMLVDEVGAALDDSLVLQDRENRMMLAMRAESE